MTSIGAADPCNLPLFQIPLGLHPDPLRPAAGRRGLGHRGLRRRPPRGRHLEAEAEAADDRVTRDVRVRPQEEVCLQFLSLPLAKEWCWCGDKEEGERASHLSKGRKCSALSFFRARALAVFLTIQTSKRGREKRNAAGEDEVNRSTTEHTPS